MLMIKIFNYNFKVQQQYIIYKIKIFILGTKI